MILFVTAIQVNLVLLHVCEIQMELQNIHYASEAQTTCCNCILQSSVGHCFLPGCWQTDTTETISRTAFTFMVLTKATVFFSVIFEGGFESPCFYP